MTRDLARSASLWPDGRMLTASRSARRATQPPMGDLIDARPASLWGVAQSECNVIQSQSAALVAGYQVDKPPSSRRGRYVGLDTTRQTGPVAPLRFAGEQRVDRLSLSLQPTACSGRNRARDVRCAAQILAPGRLVKYDGCGLVAGSCRRSALAVGRLNRSILSFELCKCRSRVSEPAQDRFGRRIGDEPEFAVGAPINDQVVARNVATECHMGLLCCHCAHDDKAGVGFRLFRCGITGPRLHTGRGGSGSPMPRLAALRGFAKRTWPNNAYRFPSLIVRLERRHCP